MTGDLRNKLRALLGAYTERMAKANTGEMTPHDQTERRTCGERLHAVARPVLEEFVTELKAAGHDASVREHIERDDAYPSVALSFTPRRGLASAIIFRYDPRHGVAAQREVKQAPWKGKPSSSATGDRLGTIGVAALSEAWVETKTLTFIEAVLKAN